jgi:hypothetical protein
MTHSSTRMLITLYSICESGLAFKSFIRGPGKGHGCIPEPIEATQSICENDNV